ncbi:17776_t:CDS:2 [Cetraspora pellucida]|uniref:17776_t:CDS:1 n=1 Tax=Cetraspora pellucida TaxID=1433469 RepID=A0ACA9M9U9_9GLOM|nr:17776_t:CDS:2 [Cetraspora pellucida]
MSQIRSDILWSRKIKNAKEYDNQIRRLHVAAPILLGNENVEQELVVTDLDYQVSDNDDVEEGTATRSHNQKNRSLEENEDLVGERENKFENKDNEILLLSEWDADFSLGGREKHPADDERAKWPLDLLIVSSLEMPLYFDSELTNF